MLQIVLVGLGAGAASALLFALVATGSLLSILLFYLAPLPIMIAALGWSHWSALFAALAASLGLAVAFGKMFFFIAFLLGVGLPAWWLGYLALLARSNNNGDVEWYPVGRIVLWCATIAAAMVVVVILNFGFDEEQFRNGLRTAFEHVLREQPRAPGANPPDLGKEGTKRLIDFLVLVMPLAAAVLATLTNTINLYLAGRVVRVSQRLSRPWPELSAIRFPSTAHAVFAAALALSFMSGLVGTVAGVVAAALTMAYGMLGFAVLHAITRNVGVRTLILSATYLVVLAIGWPIIGMALLGIADALFDIRKLGSAAQPPATTQ